jgi:hypothetical protein
MRDLLYKEFKLARHPTLFIFPFLGLLLLIPAYPYYVAFAYTCLSIFFVFLKGNETKDILFTVSLPIRKRDAVKARFWFIAIIELFQVLVAVPFALLGIAINPNGGGNIVGIEANVAFFGLVLLMYALFNAIYLPMFYRTAYKVGIPLCVAGFAMTLYVVAAEVLVQYVPALKASLDTSDPSSMLAQLPILVAGIVIYALSFWLTYRKSAALFDKVDL